MINVLVLKEEARWQCRSLFKSDACSDNNKKYYRLIFNEILEWCFR